jgi:hypothetical protein
MRHVHACLVGAVLLAAAGAAAADPVFVNGLRIRGGAVDATGQPGPNEGRLGFFSDLYYDPVRGEWWALSDRGPGGGVLDYQTRVQQIDLDVSPWSGRISGFRVVRTVKFTDPWGLLSGPQIDVARRRALNGLNPALLNLDAGELGRSFDPEGLVVDPRTGHFLVSDEYGPSLYEFDRKGRLVFAFETPANLIPKLAGGALDYVAGRGGTGIFSGRQDNRGFEGIAITPDGKKLLAVLQDPLVEEPGPNNGRDGRNVRIVVFDNDHRSWTFGTSVAQYVYQLEKQSDVLARITAAGGTGSSTDPRQGRNIGLSAIVALNDHEFLVLERDNRGIGVDNPVGKTGALGVVGSKRVYRIDVSGADDVTGVALPADTLPPDVTAVAKEEALPFIDLAANSVLPNGEQAEKWEGLTIGPRILFGRHAIVAGNDNDYSVTQLGDSLTQYDTYVDFAGRYARCPLGETALCQLDGTGDFTKDLPEGQVLLPGVLHAYRASRSDLAGYVPPRGRRDHDCDDHGRDGSRRDP